MRLALLAALLLLGTLACCARADDGDSMTDLQHQEDEEENLDNSVQAAAETDADEEADDPEAKQVTDLTPSPRRRRSRRFRRLLRWFNRRGSRRGGWRGSRRGWRRGGRGRRVFRRLRGLARLLNDLKGDAACKPSDGLRQRLDRWAGRLSRFLRAVNSTTPAVAEATAAPAVVPRMALGDSSEDDEEFN